MIARRPAMPRGGPADLQTAEPAGSSPPPPVGATARTGRELLPPLALALLAAVPRLFNLTAVDPFIDEVGWLYWAVDLFDASNPATLLTPLALEGRPPLYYWLLLLTRDLADNAIVAGRATAALTSAACAPALYALGRMLISARVGLVAGLLWAVSPFSVLFGRIASSDDVLLTLCAILTALGGAWLVRRPSLVIGAACGAGVGLAILAKTLGVLNAATPLLAVLTLTAPRTYPRLTRPGLAAVAAAALLLLPLVPWLPELYRRAATHADVAALEATAGAGPAIVGRFLPGGAAAVNLGLMTEFLTAYLGLPMLVFAGLGVSLARRRDRRAVLYLALIAAIGLTMIVAFTTTFFSRYLLSSSFPLYLLAAIGIARAADLIGERLAARSGSAIVRAALLAAGLGAALAPMLPFTARLVATPELAPLPPRDRGQYFESWQALYGLGQVADFLRREAHSGPVTVLVPRRSSDMRVLLPHQALRLYLRRDPAVRFVEDPNLWRAESLRELRAWERAGTPTFLVVNGTHSPNAGSTPDIPDYIRRLEGAIARDLPRARVVLHIPRSGGLSWLSVYRIDRR